MSDRMECMCLDCGISHYISVADLAIEISPEFEYPVVSNIFCTKCGGLMFVVGKEGEQPFYVTEYTRGKQ